MKQRATSKRKILGLMRAPKYRPLDKIELTRALGMKSDHRGALKQALRDLERAGEIARIRKNRYVLPAEADLVTGKLQIHQSGFGFLVREKSAERDVFISAENTGTAMNGDRVVARITRDVAFTRARTAAAAAPEGRVIRILERAHDTIVGTVQQSKNFFYVVPDDPRIVHNVYVQVCSRRRGARQAPTPGDKVVVRLEAWESRHVNPEGEIIEVLGRATDPGRRHAFDHPEVSSADGISRRTCSRKPSGSRRSWTRSSSRPREDLRDDSSSRSIPMTRGISTTRSTSSELAGGDWELGVHIADVSAYVTPGSALDREALKRGNSVYLAGPRDPDAARSA